MNNQQRSRNITSGYAHDLVEKSNPILQNDKHNQWNVCKAWQHNLFYFIKSYSSQEELVLKGDILVPKRWYLDIDNLDVMIIIVPAEEDSMCFFHFHFYLRYTFTLQLLCHISFDIDSH